MKVGVVGATGAVGETFLNLLEERDFPVEVLKLFASSASAGQTRLFKGDPIAVEPLNDGCFSGLDLVFFSSGDDISKSWAPRAVQAGAVVVDNSAAFRMAADVPLVVPEINSDLLPSRKVGSGQGALIANPNCSTIQLVVALNPLMQKFGLKSVQVASYQSVSGAGRDGIEELLTTTRIALEGEEQTTSKVFPQPIAFNCVPQIGSFDPEGFSSEENKIMTETPKILRRPIPVSAFTVRVPTLNGHAEAVWVTLEQKAEMKDVLHTLKSAPGLEVFDGDSTTKGLAYPTQKQASGENPVYVGRIHRDRHNPQTWIMWIVADNLKKGAALNGIQIAERIFDITATT